MADKKSDTTQVERICAEGGWADVEFFNGKARVCTFKTEESPRSPILMGSAAILDLIGALKRVHKQVKAWEDG